MNCVGEGGLVMNTPLLEMGWCCEESSACACVPVPEYILRPVRKLFARFANWRTVREPTNFFANHAKIDVTFLQYVLPVAIYLPSCERGNGQIFGEVHKIKLINN